MVVKPCTTERKIGGNSSNFEEGTVSSGFLKPCAAERKIGGDSSNFKEGTVSSGFLKPCVAKKTREGDSNSLEEAAQPMETFSSNSYLTKRKAEFDLEEEEKDDGDDEVKIAEPEAERDMFKPLDWGVDSFDGLDYYSSPDDVSSSSDDDEEAMERYRIFKRQIIESKGFHVDPEVRPFYNYKQIYPMALEAEAYRGEFGQVRKTYREYWEEMVHLCLGKHNQDKAKEDLKLEFVEVVRGNYRLPPRSTSYITFMAREKPDGDPVEYQAKCMVTFDGKRHPILCRPTPKQL